MLEHLLALAANDGGATFWMPEQASTFAADIDIVYYFIYWISVFFFFVVIGGMAYLGWKYRRRAEGERTHPLEGNVRLEVIWSVIPAILLVVIFVMGFRGFIVMAVPPGNTLDVNVTASAWNWSFQYPGLPGSSSRLVVPEKQPIKLTMSSKDVIHSFFVPAFRIKQDVLPNRYTTLWFEAKKPGQYELFCTEYCGLEHSMMGSAYKKENGEFVTNADGKRVLDKYYVEVLSTEDYRTWRDNGGPLGELKGELKKNTKTPEQLGKLLFASKGCTSCHNMNNVKKVGPGLLGIQDYVSSGAIPNGHDSIDNYLRESILNPNAYIVPGYAAQMPTYKGRIDNEIDQELVDKVGREDAGSELNWLISYLKNPSAGD